MNGLARRGLRCIIPCYWPDEKARWFRSVGLRVSNSPASQFYRQEAEEAERETIVKTGGAPAQEMQERTFYKCDEFDPRRVAWAY